MKHHNKAMLVCRRSNRHHPFTNLTRNLSASQLVRLVNRYTTTQNAILSRIQREIYEATMNPDHWATPQFNEQVEHTGPYYGMPVPYNHLDQLGMPQDPLGSEADQSMSTGEYVGPSSTGQQSFGQRSLPSREAIEQQAHFIVSGRPMGNSLYPPQSSLAGGFQARQPPQPYRDSSASNNDHSSNTGSRNYTMFTQSNRDNLSQTGSHPSVAVDPPSSVPLPNPATSTEPPPSEDSAIANIHGSPWSSAEKGGVLTCIVGPEAPPENVTIALGTRREMVRAHPDKMPAMWHTMSSVNFGGKRLASALWSQWVALVAGYVELVVKETPGAADDPTDPNLAERIQRKYRDSLPDWASSCSNLHFMDLPFWLNHPSNPWFSMMHARLKGLPQIAKKIDALRNRLSKDQTTTSHPRGGHRKSRSGASSASVPRSGKSAPYDASARPRRTTHGTPSLLSQSVSSSTTGSVYHPSLLSYSSSAQHLVEQALASAPPPNLSAVTELVRLAQALDLMQRDLFTAGTSDLAADKEMRVEGAMSHRANAKVKFMTLQSYLLFRTLKELPKGDELRLKAETRLGYMIDESFVAQELDKLRGEVTVDGAPANELGNGDGPSNEQIDVGWGDGANPSNEPAQDPTSMRFGNLDLLGLDLDLGLAPLDANQAGPSTQHE